MYPIGTVIPDIDKRMVAFIALFFLTLQKNALFYQDFISNKGLGIKIL